MIASEKAFKFHERDACARVILHASEKANFNLSKLPREEHVRCLCAGIWRLWES